MTYFIFQSVYFFILSLALALLEIQIEGPHGWAAKLPTWRPGLSHWFGRLVHRVTGGEEVTGYHLALNAVLLLFFHWPYVWLGTWSLSNELYLLGFFIWFTVVWDFLWFVLNPHHSLSNFNAVHVPWHKKWWGRVPVKYVIGLVITLALFALAGLISGNMIGGLIAAFVFIAVQVLLTVVTVFAYPRSF